MARSRNILAFPALWISGRPALAVIQPLASAYAARMSIAVHVVDCDVSACSGFIPFLHVRLSCGGGELMLGWVNLSTRSKGRSSDANRVQEGTAETRAIGKIPHSTLVRVEQDDQATGRNGGRTCISIGTKLGTTKPGQSTRRTSLVQ